MLSYFILTGKKNRPLSDFTWQCELDDVKGVKLTERYRNRTKGTEIMAAIANSAFDGLRHDIDNTNFLSIMGDDSTDVASVEQSMWFARYCTAGEVNVRFLGCVELAKADAEGIVAGLSSVVSDNIGLSMDEFMAKVGFTTTDGASVMLGDYHSFYLY